MKTLTTYSSSKLLRNEISDMKLAIRKLQESLEIMEQVENSLYNEEFEASKEDNE